MRVRSLVILLAIAGAAAYLYFFQWDFVTGLFEDVRLNMAGYTAAKTPEDAMDRFAKAIKERDYNAAARYCTKDYAALLVKGKKAAYEIGWRIDRLKNLMEEKGLNTDRGLIILYGLDPFPALFERSSDTKIKEAKKGEDKMIGAFKSTPVSVSADVSKVQGLDVKIFRNALMPYNTAARPEFVNSGVFYNVLIVPEGEGDARTWKLDIPNDEITRNEIDHMVKHYRSYANALDYLLDDIRRGRYASGKDFEQQLIDKFSDVKQSISGS